ncbi:MAG: class I SAM-dependent methyltransferase [Gammaproteobacteria bacterium]|nr:class I SAM-dependent methyltransferase [Gammaproteobacteria bacterium]
MSEKPNMLAEPDPWNRVANGYADTTMLMLSQYAEEAISSLELKTGDKVLDVACGPGTVSLMVSKQVASVHAIDFSESMLSILNNKINDSGLNNIQVSHGDGQALPYGNDSFNAAFSMFGLMFFPDRCKGFSEIYRTLKAEGRIAVSSWAPVEQSPVMKAMFGALRAIKPDLPEPEAVMESLENPEVFEKELQEAGFHDVRIQRMRKEFSVESVRVFWDGMVLGSVPIVMMKNSMGETEWLKKERLALEYLEKILPITPTSLAADAWLGVGVKKI